MKSLAIAIAAAAVAALPALGAEDPIAVRQALMDNNGTAAGVAGAVMKGELAYSPVVGKAVIYAVSATAAAYGDYFPEGSEDAARSNASPKIWQDMAGFEAELAKFQEAAAKAREIAGKDGPADADAFKAAMGPIFDSCKTCHESYRLEN
ncbi:MAG TPA: cytochrome c [Amaricoccus sp.]|nr:cytochrome c [Amaricoccus sp.]HMR62185.1 cytochrome c [Amaricoccus sp.]HMU01245.1 cytochrome c [Amaricoccus sp.]